MPRLMYDAIAGSSSAIPVNAQIVAGYVDGLYKWSSTDWARFPHSVKVRIAVFTTTDDGHVLDCEPGNNTPAASVDWVLMRRKAGVDPTVYCGRNTWWPDIRAAFKARNVPEPHYWVADYSVNQSNPQIPNGALALQYTDVGPYDLSVVADYWPGVDPAPSNPPQEDPVQNAIYAVANAPDGTSPGLWWYADGGYMHVSTIAQRDAIIAQFGAVEKPLTYAGHLALLALTATTASVDSLAAALAANGVLLKALAHAVAVELRNDLPAV